MTRAILLFVLAARVACAATSAPKLWDELEKKRSTAKFHAEFEVIRTSNLYPTQTWGLVIDWNQGKWLEQIFSVDGNYEQVVTDADDLIIHPDTGEYRRIGRAKDATLPTPICTDCGPIWTSAVELERRPCTISQTPHTCVVLQAPISEKSSLRVPSTQNKGADATVVQATDGTATALIDLETGAVLAFIQDVTSKTSSRLTETEIRFTSKALQLNPDFPPQMFSPNLSELKKVSTFSEWDAKHLEEKFRNKPAPGLKGVDLTGQPYSVVGMQGKVVLLNFCPRDGTFCSDGLDTLGKIQSTYASAGLVVVSIVGTQDKQGLNDYLQHHPANHLVVLAVESDIPREYQLSASPAYVVIAKDGTLAASAQGKQKQAALIELLQKAGLPAK